jgi:hypothetical protein
MCWCWPLSLALLAPGGQAAVFAPGAEPDPPTGDVAAPSGRADEPLKVPGFQWVLAPWQHNGSVSLDGRWQRLEDGRLSRQALLFSDIEWASYLWQPWFVQMRFGLGLLAERDTAAGGDLQPGDRSRSTSGTATGRMSLSVFPASRFPFDLRADLGDSRTRSDTLGEPLRTQRLSLSQSYRPETGNSSLHLQVDHSRLLSADSRDLLTNLQANAEHQVGDHNVALGANYSLNTRSDTADRTRLASVNAQHGFHPSSELQVDTLFSWNDQRLQGAGLLPVGLGSEVRQLTSVLNWRPREGEPLYNEHMPLQLLGSARWVAAQAIGAGGGAQAQALSATLGANLDLAASWRLAGSLSANQVDGGTAGTARSTSASSSLSWSPPSLPLGVWRYAPTATLNLGLAQGEESGRRQLAGLQGSHSLTRDWTVAEGQQVALTLSQSAAVLSESSTRRLASALANSLGLFWQGAGDGQHQRYASLSLSDTRTRAAGDGSFQFVNLQLNQRSQVTRQTSWSVNLTLQASRNESTEIDVFSGQRRNQDAGWQHFYSGGASLEQQRLFGVPRLRHTLQFNLNSMQVERRALGDIDAPRERITQSLESRVDYTIGRLELRLSARLARVDERAVALVVARLLRRF